MKPTGFQVNTTSSRGKALRCLGDSVEPLLHLERIFTGGVKMTEEQMEELKDIAQQRREENKKTLVALRLTNKTLTKAKSLGKGYTAILSRLLDLAIEDPEMLKKCL